MDSCTGLSFAEPHIADCVKVKTKNLINTNSQIYVTPFRKFPYTDRLLFRLTT